ncbi:hypothetical protein H4K35_00070 [Myroides sp. NP-2]|uniref:coiled-coil domain-containing protein n=1 Tax=Myroides sp. NP-2 TaxID=2759945 RepID=UPI0015FA933D|nr:hypothetical protein [Myroides sp. NP-2]MBB1148543.1 hypothetical protein [Myroides sp. NP-2]
MADYITIENIRTKRDEIREKIKEVDFKSYEGNTFGSENEYTYRSLIGGIESLLTDLSTLTKHKNKFIKLSTYQERVDIHSDLTYILNYVDSPTQLYKYIDNLKIKLRSYNIRNFSENQITFENEIDNVRKLKLELQEILQESTTLKDEITEKNESIETLQQETQDKLDRAKDSFEEINKELECLSEKSEEQSTLNTQLESIKTKADGYLDEITDFKNDAESNKKLIDSFATKVQERDNRLTELEQKTNENSDKLNKYEEERKKILEEAKELIENAKQALGYSTSQGLSDSFDTQYTNANKWWKSVFWIVGASLCLLGTLCLGIWVMINIQEQWFMIMGRILLLPIPIAGAVFCANQYTKQKNIIEDYAYKLTIAKAIVGFSEQLKKNGNDVDDIEYTDYIQKALGEIHKDPLRSRKEGSSVGFKSNQLDQVLELAKKIADLTKINN